MRVMTDHDDTPDDVHDVLAAEEFGMGTADPALHELPAHDVLAADEFGVGTGDPSLSRIPINIPESPSAGAGPAREVLAADAFAVPAGRPLPKVDRLPRERRRLPAILVAGALLVWFGRRRG